jgi:hypothetical protein
MRPLEVAGCKGDASDELGNRCAKIKNMNVVYTNRLCPITIVA